MTKSQSQAQNINAAEIISAKPRIRFMAVRGEQKPFIQRGDVWVRAYFKNDFEYGPDGQPMTSNEVRARRMAATKIASRKPSGVHSLRYKSAMSVPKPANDTKPRNLVKAPFGYPGGKHYYQRLISSLFPLHTHFVDVFGGAANMVLNSDALIRTYNDINSEMVNLFRVIGSENGEDFERFITMLEQTPHSRECFNASKLVNHHLVNDPVIKAHATFVKYKMSTMTNLSGWAASCGDRNHSNSVWHNGSSRTSIQTLRDQLKTIQIENDDFLKIIKRYDKPNNLLYLDPPYVRNTRSAKDMYDCEMSDDQHVTLVQAALELKNAYIVISGYDSPIYDPLVAAGWHKVQFDTIERMSLLMGTKTSRFRTETVWLSPNCDNEKIKAAIKDAKEKFNMRAVNDNAQSGYDRLKANHIEAVAKLYAKLSKDGRELFIEALPDDMKRIFQV